MAIIPCKIVLMVKRCDFAHHFAPFIIFFASQPILNTSAHNK
jgi:hypothetical protein